MAALWTAKPDEARLPELLRLLPDVVRLLRRLAPHIDRRGMAPRSDVVGRTSSVTYSSSADCAHVA